MAELTQRVCDGCGEVVHGKVKAAFVTKNYLEIKGSMILQIAATRATQADHVYLTKKYDGVPPALIFCYQEGMPCLQQFINGKLVFVKELREKQLKTEANTSYLKKLDYEPEAEFVIGHKR